MKQEYWLPDELRKAAHLLEGAASNLHTAFPHSNRSPHGATAVAAKAMIAAALECIKNAQPH